MKRFIIINLTIAGLGVLVGIFVWSYLKVKPLDKAKYDMYVYHLNQEKEVEQSLLSKTKKDVRILLRYYNERKENLASQVTLEKDKGSFFVIPLNGKAKLIDTVGDNVARIQLLYKTKHDDFERVTGYVPLINLHATPPAKNKLNNH